MSKPLPELPDLLPGFTERLEARAEEVAAAHRETTRVTPDDATPRRNRRRWRLGGGAALVGFVAISSAYATGIWHPELGSNADAPPVASARPVAPDLLNKLAVLRRPQTDADRGAASTYALKFPATERIGVQTAAVRVVSLPGGTTVVLIPMVDLDTGTQDLCLWVRRPGADRGGRSCATTAEVIGGEFVQAEGTVPSSEVERTRADRRRDAQGDAPDEGGGVQQQPTTMSGTFRVLGIVPDGVRSVHVGSSAPIPVDQNLFDGTMTDVSPDLRARWDD